MGRSYKKSNKGKRKNRNVFSVILSYLARWIFKALGFLFVCMYKALLLIFRLVLLFFSRIVANIQLRIKKNKALARQPKFSAQFEPLPVKDTVKGSFADFEERLLAKSLIIAVAGRRGSGKSALGFRLLENVHAKSGRQACVYGVKQELVPKWIKSVGDVAEAGNGSVLLVDEGAVSFGARDSMSAKNKRLAEILAVARHKDLTLILVTQNTSMIDKNVLNLCDTIFLKEGSLLQERMERDVMRGFFVAADAKFKAFDRSERVRYAYVYDDDFEGLVFVPLPTFWSNDVSKS